MERDRRRRSKKKEDVSQKAEKVRFLDKAEINIAEWPAKTSSRKFQLGHSGVNFLIYLHSLTFLGAEMNSTIDRTQDNQQLTQSNLLGHICSREDPGEPGIHRESIILTAFLRSQGMSICPAEWGVSPAFSNISILNFSALTPFKENPTFTGAKKFIILSCMIDNLDISSFTLKRRFKSQKAMI